MGTAHSSPSASSSPANAEPPAPPPGCPMHKGASSPSMAALAASAKRPPPRGPVYNVYGQEIDPKNMMPPPNQSPAAGQVEPLPTERVKSSIPKGGTEGHWLYPSPQMFYNSLLRKNKAEGVAEGDVPMVVSIHNEMNERTWGAMLEWEALHPRDASVGGPSLRRFMGNPYKLSPKARLKSLFGWGFPFDRHDWYVDRGDQLVHYVIDYYYNPSGPANAPPPPDATGPRALQLTNSIYVDVRPAIESVEGLVDRLRLFPARMAAAFSRPRFCAEGIDPSLPRPPEDVSSGAAASAPGGHGSDAVAASAAPATPLTPAAAAAAAQWAAVDTKCGPLLDKLKVARDDGERRSAQMAVNYCMGRIVCPNEAARFMAELSAGGEKAGEAGGTEEAAFLEMTQCVGRSLSTR